MRRNFDIPAALINKKTDGVQEALMRSCMYASDTLLVFSPDFKKQRMFITAVLEKYSNFKEVNTVLTAQYDGIGLYDIIYRPFTVPLWLILQDQTLKQCTNIEITALDFSISSLETTAYFKAAFSASAEERKQRIEVLLKNTEFNTETAGADFSLLFDLRFTGMNTKGISAYKKKLDNKYFMNQKKGGFRYTT